MTFNFLASLINGNSKIKSRQIIATPFNFLASLINGNSFVSGFTADTNKTPFNFLASLINGNLPPHSSLYRRVLNLF